MSSRALSKKSHKGTVVIVSSPSGGGKTTICRKLLSTSRKKLGWQFSVSCTTRSQRKGERDGREYHFVSDAQFDKKVARNEFAEHFQVHLYKYGTPRAPLETVLRTGGVMLLDVDIQGAQRLQREYPQAVTIFIKPPSKAVLRHRLKSRGTETAAQLKLRCENAIHEMESFRAFGFEYVVVNEELTRAVRQVLAIIEAHPCRLDKLK